APSRAAAAPFSTLGTSRLPDSNDSSVTRLRACVEGPAALVSRAHSSSTSRLGPGALPGGSCSQAGQGPGAMVRADIRGGVLATVLTPRAAYGADAAST